MASHSFFSATTGFLCGSLVTLVATYYYALSNKKQATKPETSKRSLMMAQASTARSMKAAVVAHVERAGFLSDLMAQLWPYIAEAGAEMIKESVELPQMLKFTKLDLGKIPVRLDNIIVHNIENETVQFDVDVVWDGECDIRLQASKIASFGVKAIKLAGRMSFLLKPLSNELPCFAAIQYAFVNPPTIQLNFTGLANLADTTMLRRQIDAAIQASLADMMVLPNRMLYKMDLATNFLDIYEPPKGLLRLTVVRGRGFVVEKRTLLKDDVPDVYCNVTLGNRQWVTKTIKDNLSPEWNETADFVLSDHDQVIRVDAWDEDGGPLDPDDDLGVAEVTVGELLLAGKSMELPLMTDSQSTGAFVTIQCQLGSWSPDLTTLKETKDANLYGGLLTIVITQCFDLPLTKKEASSFVKVVCGKHEFVTGVVTDYPGYDALNPQYDIAFRVPIVQNNFESVSMTLMNGVDTILGTLLVTREELEASPDRNLREIRSIGNKGARLEFGLALRGVLMEDESSSTASRTVVAPSNDPRTIRVMLVRGRGFVVKKRRLRKADVPDVYCQIRFGSSPHVWRTATIDDSVNPVWGEKQEYLMVNPSQVLHVDAWDANRKSKDTPLGSVRVAVGQILLEGGRSEVELLMDGKRTGYFLTIQVDMVGEE